ncbi:MAG: twin-arginine translocase subunit TatC [Methanosarcinales archaeon]|jgi:sec-independent protein translocase protein TatC|nr:twin-arginine translocase subunit TatC [Methanosarcinales archaeon]
MTSSITDELNRLDFSASSPETAQPAPEILPPQENGKKRPEGDYEEHVVGHLKELRNRIIIAGAALLLGAFVFYPFSGEAVAYLWDRLIPETVIMSIYSPTEYLMTRLKLSAAAAVCIFFPLLMYELFKFMSRGLYKNERKFLVKVVPLSFLLFIFGAALAYFIVLPLFLNYILFYSDQTAVAQIGLGETFNTIISLVLGFGLVFQIPLLMVSVVRMGIVEEKTLRKGRVVVYGMLLGFTFLIAPDPTMVSQLIAGAALVILFEFSLILLKFV